MPYESSKVYWVERLNPILAHHAGRYYATNKMGIKSIRILIKEAQKAHKQPFYKVLTEEETNHVIQTLSDKH